MFGIEFLRHAIIVVFLLLVLVVVRMFRSCSVVLVYYIYEALLPPNMYVFETAGARSVVFV
jgi:hypothetical protein